jgi:hypothetical protein
MIQCIQRSASYIASLYHDRSTFEDEDATSLSALPFLLSSSSITSSVTIVAGVFGCAGGLYERSWALGICGTTASTDAGDTSV